MDAINDFSNRMINMYDPILLTILYVYLLFALLIFLIVLLNMLFFADKYKNKIDLLVNKLDARGFIKFTDGILRRKISRRLRAILLLNKAFALGMQGDYDECFVILNNLKKYMLIQKNENLNLLYHNNYLAFLLVSNQTKKAIAYYQQEKSNFYLDTKNKKMEKMINSTLSQFYIENGNPARGKKELLKSLKKSDSLITKLEHEYYIGLADLKMKNKAEAIKRFKRIYPKSKNIFIGANIRKLIGKELAQKS